MVNRVDGALSLVIIRAIGAPSLELTARVQEDAQLDLKTRGPPLTEIEGNRDHDCRRRVSCLKEFSLQLLDMLQIYM